ncbi:MAG: oxygenase MpaB family protein [Aeromicrobium sp.]
MSCPISHEAFEGAVSDAASELLDQNEAVRQFDRFGGTVFLALFAPALYDQAMDPEISAALEATGRIANNPWERAGRTAASDQLVFIGDDEERIGESERLKRMHRDVKGISPDGVRYSALNPETWNWIMYSTMFMHIDAFCALTGNQLTDEDAQAIWDFGLSKLDHLQLPGRSRLLEDYTEARVYYRTFAAERLQPTPTSEAAVGHTLAPPRPDFVPWLAEPAWSVVAPMAGHVTAVLGFGIMDPAVRQHLPFRWTKRHDLEFTALSTAARLGYRYLPRLLTETPLARNRRQYRRLTQQYQDAGLSSFAPSSGKAS